MIFDALLSFVPIGAPLSLAQIVGDYPSTNIIDLLGSGAGTVPTNIIGNATLFGMDVGIGGIRPELNVVVGTAFVSGGGGTLNVKLQAAPDTAVTYLPGAYVTLAETGAMAVANLTAGVVVARFPFLPAFPANLSPRYIRLLFTIATATVTAGTISSANVTMVRDDQANKFAASNFKVA